MGAMRIGEIEERRASKEAVAEFGVAYATMQCADLLAKGAPGIHFYTLNRSPATRAILSSLKLWRPWDPEHTGLGEPRRPPAASTRATWSSPTSSAGPSTRSRPGTSRSTAAP